MGMPILSQQRRMMRIGTIRAGDQQPDKNGKLRANKLETWRLTSNARDVLQAAAAIYGGEVRPWNEGTESFELYTASDTLDVAIPPAAQVYSQAWEQWGGGGRKRRCDGQMCELVTDEGEVVERPCMCDPESPDCSPTTRINLMLTRVPGLGTWLMTSHGMYAALELPGALDVLRYLTDGGRPIAGRLRLEQRTVKKQGEKYPRKFAVPVLDLDVTIGALMAGEASPSSLAPGRVAGHLPATAAGVEDAVAAATSGPESPVEREAPEPPAPPAAADLPAPMKQGTRSKLFAAANENGIDRETVRLIARFVLGHGLSEATEDEAERMERSIERYAAGGEEARNKLAAWALDLEKESVA